MKFKLYQDDAREWRWTLRARNGRVVADGSEGYKRKGACRKAVERLRDAIARAPIVDYVKP